MLELIGLNVLALAIFWLLGFALIRLAERALGGWPATEAAQLVASAAGVWIALRMSARVAAYFAGGMLAFSVAELVIHLIFGLRSLQGAPKHFAVMAAAALGVLIGALLVSFGGVTGTAVPAR